MPKQLQLRRASTVGHAAFVGAAGEVTVDTTKQVLVVHDGVQTAGYPLARADTVIAERSAALGTRKLSGGVIIPHIASSARVVFDLSPQTGLNISDTTILASFKAPTTNPSTTAVIWCWCASVAAPNTESIKMEVSATGILRVRMRAVTTADERLASVNANLVSGWSGKPVVVKVSTTAAGVLSISIDGVEQAYTESTGGTAPAWNYAHSDLTLFVGSSSAGNAFVTTFYRFAIFNRILSNTETVNWKDVGTPYEDKDGSVTVLNSGTFTIQNRYRIVTRTDADFTTIGAADNVVGTEFIATGTGAGLLDAGDTVLKIGRIGEPDFTYGIGYQLQGLGSNKIHGFLSGTFAHAENSRREGQIRFKTSASGNIQILGGVCILTNARIRNIIAETPGTPTVTVGQASAGTTIAGSSVLTASRNDLTIVARYSTNGQLWINSTTADVINWTFIYDLVD
jgi:hypothetical protein